MKNKYVDIGMTTDEALDPKNQMVPFSKYLLLQAKLAGVVDEKEDILHEHWALQRYTTELEQSANELIDVLKQINKEEMDSIRPGGSPSKSARISYEALKKFGAIE